MKRKNGRPALSANAPRASHTPGAIRHVAEALERRLMLTGNPSPHDKAADFFNASDAVFVQNRGQWADTSIRYAFNGQGINVGFTDTGPVLELLRAKPPAPQANSPSRSPADPHFAADHRVAETERAQITMSFDNAQPAKPVGAERSTTAFNFLVGEQSRHRSNVPAYQQIRYAGLYDGIDLHTRGKRNGLKYEFHVAPGADWRDIRVSYGGIAGLTLAADGSLRIATPLGELVEEAPILYQEADQNRVPVAGRFVLLDADTYGFAVTGAYDPSRELVIDPDLAWATYLGGSGADTGQGIAVDGSGNVYVTGYTDSAGWATDGAHDATYNGGKPADGGDDVFVAKLSPSGSSLLYATYLGGYGKDTGYGIAVDAAGNAYVTGVTTSTEWATAGAYDTTHNGGFLDAFVAKLSPSGSSLLYATYLGGNSNDSGQGIALDGAGNAYVTGNTYSDGWATAGAHDTTCTFIDAFAAKLNPSGSSLLYATYLGGDAGMDVGTGIDVDAAGNAYLTGWTFSAGWATAGAYDATYNGGTDGDAFVAKLNPSGSALLYATYLGGNRHDRGFAIAVDRAGNAFVTGITASLNWATAGAYDTTHNGGIFDRDIFVAKLNPSGSSLLYATYLGGSAYDLGQAIAVDDAGNAYVTGSTASAGWATAGAYDTTYNGGPNIGGNYGDAFVAKLNPSGSSLLYASYIGGSNNEIGLAIAIDRSGNAYVTGTTLSAGWATLGAFDPTYNGTGGAEAGDVFVLRFTALVELPVLLPGDANGDRAVNFIDLVILAQNYNASGKTWATGDFTGDGNVGFGDLVILAQNYNTALPAPAAVILSAPARIASTPAAKPLSRSHPRPLAPQAERRQNSGRSPTGLPLRGNP